jgi:hypothetical protein
MLMFGHPIKMPSSLPFSHGAKGDGLSSAGARGVIFNPLPPGEGQGEG